MTASFCGKGIRRLISWNTRMDEWFGFVALHGSLFVNNEEKNSIAILIRRWTDFFLHLFSFLTWNFGKRFGRQIQFFSHFCLAMLIGNWCMPVFCFSTGPKNTNKIFPCSCLWQSFRFFSLPFIACQWFPSNSALNTAHSRLCFVVPRRMTFKVQQHGKDIICMMPVWSPAFFDAGQQSCFEYFPF